MPRGASRERVMTEIESILEAARSFAVQHAPTEALRGAVPAAIVLLVAGVGISVLGAKLARFGMTTMFVVVGGALANVADRATGGSVVDFLDVGRWPTFNLADVFLLTGIALLLFNGSGIERGEAAPTSA